MTQIEIPNKQDPVFVAFLLDFSFYLSIYLVAVQAANRKGRRENIRQELLFYKLCKHCTLFRYILCSTTLQYHKMFFRLIFFFNFTAYVNSLLYALLCFVCKKKKLLRSFNHVFKNSKEFYCFYKNYWIFRKSMKVSILANFLHQEKKIPCEKAVWWKFRWY